ncbi:hypothetical protein FOA52_004812 [Chlamydomonas sp. UWO 241]|nr:hypothetical protein FOA52_004812 [Chlamydomonas sp. UWO 241]
MTPAPATTATAATTSSATPAVGSALGAASGGGGGGLPRYRSAMADNASTVEFVTKFPSLHLSQHPQLSTSQGIAALQQRLERKASEVISRMRGEPVEVRLTELFIAAGCVVVNGRWTVQGAGGMSEQEMRALVEDVLLEELLQEVDPAPEARVEDLQAAARARGSPPGLMDLDVDLGGTLAGAAREHGGMFIVQLVDGPTMLAAVPVPLLPCAARPAVAELSRLCLNPRMAAHIARAVPATATAGSPLSQGSARSNTASARNGSRVRGVLRAARVFLDGNPPSATLTHWFMTVVAFYHVIAVCVGALPLDSLIPMWPYVTVAVGAAGLHLVRAMTGCTLPPGLLDFLNANLTVIIVTARIAFVCAVLAHGVATGRPLPTWLSQKLRQHLCMSVYTKLMRAVFEDYCLSLQLPVVFFMHTPIMWWGLWATAAMGSPTSFRSALFESASYLAMVAIKRTIEAVIVSWLLRTRRHRALRHRAATARAARAAAAAGQEAWKFPDDVSEATKPTSSPALSPGTAVLLCAPLSAPSVVTRRRG